MRFALLSIVVIFGLASAALPGNTNSLTISDGVTINYSISGNNINIEAIVTNQGAIGVGIGGAKMAGIDVAHLWYENNKVNIIDRNYINPPQAGQVLTDAERGGSNDFVDNGSTYDAATGAWKTNFSRKLVTGDTYDVDIVDGKEIQLSVALFSSQTNWGPQHTKAVYKTVTLSSALADSFTPKLIFAVSMILALFLAL